jgi:pimeloyl-ACP methyl ester carboxylesterase
MNKKIALAVLHGIGDQKEDFSKVFSEELTKRFTKNLTFLNDSPEHELIIQPIYWGSVFNEKERMIWDKLSNSSSLDFKKLRQFILHFFGDAIAYQPSADENQNYNKVHEIFAEGIQVLRKRAGDDAPLYVVAHSLGTVITSNYFYDLQYIPEKIPSTVKKRIGDSPIERGETLTGFYSLGSPLALWSLRYADFERPIHVPSKKQKYHYIGIDGGWINIYDRDDVFGYPLKSLNQAYHAAVKEDIEMNIGNWPLSAMPTSHMYYFTTEELVNKIADELALAWKKMNPLNKDA